MNGSQSQEGSSRRKSGGLSQADTSLAPSEDGPPEWQASGSNAFLNHILAINHRGDHEAPSKYNSGQSNPRAGLGEGAGLADLFHREAGRWFWAHLKCSRGPSRSGLGSEPLHPDRSPEEGDCWPHVE